MKNTDFETYVKEMKNGTYDFTCNGKCIECGNCCSNLLPMTDEEILIIKKYIKQYKIKENKHLVPLSTVALDLTCPFLDNGKNCEKCTIYEVRPKICRDFICDPKQRPKADLEWGLKCRPVNVREEFFR